MTIKLPSLLSTPENMHKPQNPNDQERYFNREQSWLEFNARVLDEALCTKTPLLERLRFLSIFTSNLDEFFMVRVAGLLKMRQEGIVESDSPEEIDSEALLRKIRRRTIELMKKQYACFHEEIIPALSAHQVRILKMNELNQHQKDFAKRYFTESVFPVLTPLAYDAAHPFPFLANLSLYLLLVPEEEQFDADHTIPKMCFVEIPSILPRLIRLPSEAGNYQYLLLGDLIYDNLDQLFLGIKFLGRCTIRVTRNLDYNLLENDVVDLLKSIKKEVVTREHQEVVRIEIDASLPRDKLQLLKSQLDIEDLQVYKVPPPIFLPSFTELCNLPFPQLKYPPFNPRLPARLAGKENIFSIISEEDILVHHPYDSFYTFTEFLQAAAADPNVLAIKQTLYRTVGDSPIIESLIEAAREGKQVTAVVELKARFDEKNNIVWARQLERSGVNVVFGFVGLKTHAKMTLVVRKEDTKLVRYVHLSTGNYNPITATRYTDVGLFTVDKSFADDVSKIFNLMTGANLLNISHGIGKQNAPSVAEFAISPIDLRQTLLELIDNEIAEAKKGKPAKIMAKMNALVDRRIIDKLYDASKAGVKIQLIVRGICCLRPGVIGFSENIEVRSIIDRFLEHSRIFYFHAGGSEEIYLSSADWMPRNMDRRIEVMFPIKNPSIKDRIINEILKITWADNQNARRILEDGSYERLTTPDNQQPVRAQSKFIYLARQGGLKSIPYDKALKFNPANKKGRPVETQRKRRKRFK